MDHQPQTGLDCPRSRAVAVDLVRSRLSGGYCRATEVLRGTGGKVPFAIKGSDSYLAEDEWRRGKVRGHLAENCARSLEAILSFETSDRARSFIRMHYGRGKGREPRW